MSRLLGSVVTVLVVAAVVFVARGAFANGDGGGGGTRGSAPASSTTTAGRSGTAALPEPVGGSTTFSAASAAAPPGRDSSVVARARTASIAVYAHPGAARPQRTLTRRTLEGRRLPIVFRVVGKRGAWLHVAVPARPNNGRAWIRRSAVRLARTDYRVVVKLKEHRLVAYEGTHTVLRTRIGVGRSLSPTPTGTYFVTDLLRPPDPKGFYGPYAFGLSAYSPVYTSFAGGDGQIGIHGTDEPSALGHDVSHGCIRLRNADITRLARTLPLGTPVTIQT
jgi:lipoprotein-anchoring transpeptidase ErfK/SrfK